MITIFGQVSGIYKEQQVRLKKELQMPELPTHRKAEIEGLLFWIQEILREIDGQKAEGEA